MSLQRRETPVWTGEITGRCHRIKASKLGSMRLNKILRGTEQVCSEHRVAKAEGTKSRLSIFEDLLYFVILPTLPLPCGGGDRPSPFSLSLFFVFYLMCKVT